VGERQLAGQAAERDVAVDEAVAVGIAVRRVRRGGLEDVRAAPRPELVIGVSELAPVELGFAVCRVDDVVDRPRREDVPAVRGIVGVGGEVGDLDVEGVDGPDEGLAGVVAAGLERSIDEVCGGSRLAIGSDEITGDIVKGWREQFNGLLSGLLSMSGLINMMPFGSEDSTPGHDAPRIMAGRRPLRPG